MSNFRLSILFALWLFSQSLCAASIFDIANFVTANVSKSPIHTEISLLTGVYPVIDATGKPLPLELDERQKFRTRQRPNHLGVDLVVPYSYRYDAQERNVTFSAVSMFDGCIVDSGRNGYGDGGRGNWVRIQVSTENGGFVLEYEHLKTPVDLSKFADGLIKKGEVISEIGGTAYGQNYLPTQLHIGTLINNKYADPLPLITNAFMNGDSRVTNQN